MIHILCNYSNLNHLFNLLVPYSDTSPKEKKTILPLKNFTPAHWFRIQPAPCFIKHRLKIFFSVSFLKFFFVSLSPGQLHLLQSIVTAARYQSTQGQASLFAITVCYTWLFINHPNKDRFLRENKNWNSINNYNDYKLQNHTLGPFLCLHNWLERQVMDQDPLGE